MVVKWVWLYFDWLALVVQILWHDWFRATSKSYTARRSACVLCVGWMGTDHEKMEDGQFNTCLGLSVAVCYDHVALCLGW